MYTKFILNQALGSLSLVVEDQVQFSELSGAYGGILAKPIWHEWIYIRKEIYRPTHGKVQDEWWI